MTSKQSYYYKAKGKTITTQTEIGIVSENPFQFQDQSARNSELTKLALKGNSIPTRLNTSDMLHHFVPILFAPEKGAMGIWEKKVNKKHNNGKNYE